MTEVITRPAVRTSAKPALKHVIPSVSSGMHTLTKLVKDMNLIYPLKQKDVSESVCSLTFYFYFGFPIFYTQFMIFGSLQILSILL